MAKKKVKRTKSVLGTYPTATVAKNCIAKFKETTQQKWTPGEVAELAHASPFAVLHGIQRGFIDAEKVPRPDSVTGKIGKGKGVRYVIFRGAVGAYLERRLNLATVKEFRSKEIEKKAERKAERAAAKKAKKAA